MQARTTSFGRKALSILVAIVMTFSLTPTFSSAAYATDASAAQTQDVEAQVSVADTAAGTSADEASAQDEQAAEGEQGAKGAQGFSADEQAPAQADADAAPLTVDDGDQNELAADESEVTGGQTIENSGTYKVKAGSTGTITVAGGIEVKLVGQGIGNADDKEATAYKNLTIVVGEASQLTLSGMRIHNTPATSADIVDAVDFTGTGTLATEGDNLIDLDANSDTYGASAAIHVGPAAKVTFKGSGNLYVYKWMGGAAIGSHGDGETCGSMKFESGTWLLAGNKLGPVIGGDSTVVKNGDIEITGGAIYATSIAMGACIGASASGIAGDVTVSGGTLELWSDWGGSSIGRGGNGTEADAGTLKVTGGSVKSMVGPNAFQKWGITSAYNAPVVTNNNLTAKTTDAEGKEVAVLTFDASEYLGSSIDVTVDGKPYYSGSLYQYSTQPATSHSASYTPLRWTKGEQTNLYFQVAKTTHVIKVGDDTYIYAWNADAQAFQNVTPAVDTSWYNASQTSFTLNSPEQLAGLSAIVAGKVKTIDPATGKDVTVKDSFEGKTITLGGSIDLTGYYWNPIGSQENPFKGTFNGLGREVSNLNVSTDKGYAGLFGYVAAGATVKNLVLNGNVATSASVDYVGAVAGYNAGTISRVQSSVVVNAPAAYNVGGIAGFNDGGYNAAVSTTEPTGGAGSMSMCSVTGNVTGYGKVGGIAGESSGSVAQSFATATVDGLNTGSKNGVGGIVGRNGNNNTALEAGTIDSCYFMGTVGRGGQKWVGGITGFNNAKSSIANCYMAGTLVAGGGYCNAIAGNQEGAGRCSNNYSLDTIASKGSTEGEIGIAKTDSELKAADMVSLLNGEGSAYVTDANAANAGYPVLAWTNQQYVDAGWYNTTDTTFTLKSASEVAALAAIVNGTAADIAQDSFAGKTAKISTDINFAADSSSAGTAMSPIGDADHAFAGTFDGSNRLLSNIKIAQGAGGYAGLFGNIAATGVVKNFYAAGEVSATGGDYVGGVAGYNAGKIQNVTADLAVNAPSSYNVGGIAGFNDGGYNAAVSTTEPTGGAGIIEKSSAIADVTGQSKVGGIAGENSGAISQCFAKGTVDGQNTDSKNGVGGIAGRNGNNNAALEAGTIDSCYFMGTVGRGGQKWVGGITGFNNAKSSIANCYMAGTLVAGGGYCNAIAGNQEGAGRCSNNYSLDTIASMGSTEGEIGIAKTDSELKAADMVSLLNGEGSAYATDRFSENEGYPVLAWVNDSHYDVSWYSTASATFTLTDAYQLKGLAAIVNGQAMGIAQNSFKDITVKLGGDISFEDCKMTPIGDEDHPFEGTFDGNAYTLSKLSIADDTTGGYVGLFGNVGTNATITNFTVEGTISAAGGDYVGGVTGYNSGVISKVNSNVNVDAPNVYNVGGIAGFNDGGYNAAVSTTEPTGGAGIISQCTSAGTITGQSKVGGIAGENSGIITLTSSTATVDGQNTDSKNGVGGIAGRNGNNNAALEAGTIDSCYFMGTVGRGGQKWVGGITGFNNAKSSIANCYMAGTLVAGGGYYNAIAGNQEGAANCSNNYSLDTIASKGSTEGEIGIAKTEAEFKTYDMIKLLGVNAYGLDTEGINNGFPVFYFNSDTTIKGNEISGATRIETAIAAAKSAYPDGAEGVIIATAGNFPDSLSASSLAGALDYPILLTNADEAPEALLEAIAALGAKHAIVVGGDGVVNDNCYEQISKAVSGNIERLAGDTRYDTQVKIYAYGAKMKLWQGDAIVATGQNFADALSISSYAAAKKAPIFLVDASGSFSASQASYLQSDYSKAQRVIIVGGEAAVPESTEAWLTDSLGVEKVERLYGLTRYNTCGEIANFCISEGMSASSIGIATGQNYADALVAGPVLARSNGVLLIASANDSEGYAYHDHLDSTAIEMVEDTIAPIESGLFVVDFYGGHDEVSPLPQTWRDEVLANLNNIRQGIED